jgi:ATP-dependent helicase/nuclease subunit B
MLSKTELFTRLAEGHAARITVVTPNRRLAQTLMSEFDVFQIKKGLTVWEAPDILPFGAFVERLWEDALYSDLGESLPLLLTEAQEQRLWEEILADSGLFALSQAAAQCRDAWRLVNAWRIGPGQGTEDALAFSQWLSLYKKKTAADIDAARLPDLMARRLGSLKTPKLLVAYAFDVLPPQTRELLEKLQFTECKPERVAASPLRTSFPSAKHELEAAAKWARARLEDGKPRIAVVIPDLQTRRREAVRIFSRVMQPAYNLPGAAKTPMPFNVSLGEPLSNYPVIDFALGFLELVFQPVAFARASHLIRSPLLGGADSEMAARARLDARLRKNFTATVSLPKLIASVEACPLLRRALEKVLLVSREAGPQTAADWARHFSALLDAAGFPGERALDSDEFQTRGKWHEVLGEFSKVERTSKEMSPGEALAFLRRLCADTLFQPETPDAPIQVLGVLESAGLRFDCLWVSGLTDEAWPLAARPNPFIPIALQKKAGIPQASAEASLELDRRLTEQWKGAAHEVVFSFPLKEKDRDLAPSPLILDVPESTVSIPDYPSYRDLLFESRRLESFEDHKAPKVVATQVVGGTRVLSDQAACPFRAFAIHRLGAKPLEEPAPGPDARDRGKLVHALMASLWRSLKSSKALERDLEPAIAAAAAEAVKEVGLEVRLAELERERLAKVAREWLEVEKRRAPFEVVSVEQKTLLTVAGLEFSARIDRIDRLAEGRKAGGHVLIDYKTGGNPGTRHWEGPRPDDPQLPLYAGAVPGDLAAVAFAKVKTGEMKFIGYARADHLVPNVKPYRDWQALLAQWKKDAEALGAAFAAGDARVDPKEALKTCRLCDLQTLCRVYEKFSALGTEEGEA